MSKYRILQLGTAVALLFVSSTLAPTASASVILQNVGDFLLSISDPVPVGDGSEELYSMVLSVEKTYGGDFTTWPISFAGQIDGQLHHEQFSYPFPPFDQVPTPTLFTSGGNPIDTHFLPEPRIIAMPPSEALIDDATSSEPGIFGGRTGFGGPLSGEMAFFDGMNPPTSPKLDIAQLVVPSGFGSSRVTYDFSVVTPTVNLGASFQGEFYPFVVCDECYFPPVIAPLVHWWAPTVPETLDIHDFQLAATDETTAPEDLVWSDLVYQSGPGKLDPSATDPMMTPDGILNWNLTGWERGTHNLHATVTDEAGNSTTALAFTAIWVPEPGTTAMATLAMIGLAGIGRIRRPAVAVVLAADVGRE